MCRLANNDPLYIARAAARVKGQCNRPRRRAPMAKRPSLFRLLFSVRDQAPTLR